MAFKLEIKLWYEQIVKNTLGKITQFKSQNLISPFCPTDVVFDKEVFNKVVFYKVVFDKVFDEMETFDEVILSYF